MATFAASDRMNRVAATLGTTALFLTAACSGSSSPPASAGDRLRTLLQQPVATPSSCGGKVSGSTAGRRSPWVGTVDVSVFLKPSAAQSQIDDVGRRLRALPQVRTVYFESAAEAYAEFQRLYTCSADVPRSAVPASYRLVLTRVTRPRRDQLVAQLLTLPGISSVSCDPSSPCTDVRPGQ